MRTWESLAARTVDGGEALYGPFIDFGFCKRGEDALERWGRNAVVAELVRAIRLTQPSVVLSRWSGAASDGHGHHQAIGMAVRRPSRPPVTPRPIRTSACHRGGR